MLIKKRFSNKKVKALTGIITACLIFCGTLFALPIQNARGNDSSYPPNDSNYEKVWWDEFNDTSLNREKWDYYVGGWNASEVQNCYKDSPENVNVSGGSLNLVGLYKPGLTCNQGRNGDFTSGFVHTKDKKAWTYGYFEARIKMPTNKSTWPAFWMSPQEAKYGGWPKSGEIDIVETKGSNLNYAASDAHWGISSVDKSHSQRVIETDKFSDASQWHTYGVKWTEGKLEFYIDGNRYHEIKDFSQPNSTNHPGHYEIGRASCRERV